MPSSQELDDWTFADLIGIEELKAIQNSFTKSTGLVAAVYDADCNFVIEYGEQYDFYSFCASVRKTKEGWARCYADDAKGCSEALAAGRPYVYTCHAGLLNVTTPVIIDGKPFGFVICGQAILEPRSQAKIEDIARRVSDLHLDVPVSKAIRAIPVISTAKLGAISELLRMIAEYVVKNSMIRLMQRQLLQDVKSQASLEKALIQSELRYLRSQINPHFLFNTLNTIARLAYVEGAGETENVAYCLADLLRYSFVPSDDVTTIAEEISFLKQYLHIQSVRFSDRFEYRLDVKDDVLDVSIPRLILQPIVENALTHGLDNKIGKRTLILKASRSKENVALRICDDGAGMTREQVQKLMRGERVGRKDSIGLMNVRKRLDHYYGSRYALRITSSPGKGTKVSIDIPASLTYPG